MQNYQSNNNYVRTPTNRHRTYKPEMKIQQTFYNPHYQSEEDRRFSYTKQETPYKYENLTKLNNFSQISSTSFQRNNKSFLYENTASNYFNFNKKPIFQRQRPNQINYTHNNKHNFEYQSYNYENKNSLGQFHKNTYTKKLNQNSFQKFLQLAKKEKLRNIYIPEIKQQNNINNQNINMSKNINKISYSNKKFYNNIQQLRETEDTLADMDTIKTNNNNKKNARNIKIQDFIKLKLLGKGKNGQVYMVLHKLSGFACAMKIIKKKQINRGNPIQKQMIHNQLLRQIKIHMSLSNPNIVDLYGVFADSQNIYLIQQLGLNGPLYDLMKKKKKFSEQTTALISRDVLKGLQGLHSKNIIHRDIKPQNIVLVFGVSKICDFGWSVFCPVDLRKTLCGTPLYLSPQILIGDEYNQKIDIWAFGTLVYELFTGQNPFKIKNKSDLSRIVTDQVSFSDNFPRRLRNFFEFILKKNSSQRPTSKQIQQHDFFEKYVELQTSQEISNI